MTPCVVAEITVALLVAIPTCDAPPPLVLKKTRSPAWMFARLTGTPTPNCAQLVRGRLIPACRNAHWVRPEQSNPLGPTPAVTYGAPILDCAAPTADIAPPPPGAGLVAGADPERPSAPRVCGPTTPSTVNPRDAWNAFTACRVCGPNTPSAGSPSFCWSWVVTAGLGFGPRIAPFAVVLVVVPPPPPPSAAPVIGPMMPSTS